MLILQIAFVFIAAFLLTYVLVPLNIKFSNKMGIVDLPKERSVHKTKTPLAGGISIVIPALLIFIVLSFLDKVAHPSHYRSIVVGGLAISVLGFLDDKHSFAANFKLLWQFLVALYMSNSGFLIDILTNPLGNDIHLGWLAYPFTIVWFLVVMNAFNLIDGIDGLAAGITTIFAFVMMLVSVRTTNQFVFFISLTLFGSNLAFLKYNFFPAKIFMGDTGSLFLGFLIAAVSITGNSQFKGITAITILIPLVALFFPLADILWAIIRRLKNKKHIFQADKEHIHHKLLGLGLSQKSVALLVYFLTFLFGLVAFGFSFAPKQFVFVLLILLFIIMLILFYYTFFRRKND